MNFLGLDYRATCKLIDELNLDYQVKVKTMFGGSGLFVGKVYIGAFYDGVFYISIPPKYLRVFNHLAPVRYIITKGSGVAKTHLYQCHFSSRNHDVIKETFNTAVRINGNSQRFEELKRRRVTKISNMINMSAKYERMLRKVGVNSEKELRSYGAIGCYNLLKDSYPNLTVEVLFKLEGALQKIHIQTMDENLKMELVERLGYMGKL